MGAHHLKRVHIYVQNWHSKTRKYSNFSSENMTRWSPMRVLRTSIRAISVRTKFYHFRINSEIISDLRDVVYFDSSSSSKLDLGHKNFLTQSHLPKPGTFKKKKKKRLRERLLDFYLWIYCEVTLYENTYFFWVWMYEIL